MDPYTIGILAGLAIVLFGGFIMFKRVSTDDDDGEVTLGRWIQFRGGPGLIVAAMGCFVVLLCVWCTLRGDGDGDDHFAALMFEEEEAEGYWDDDSAGDDDSAWPMEGDDDDSATPDLEGP